MHVVDSILECIGQTPLIKLTRFNPSLPFNVYAKCEMFNPSLSIKDRIVYAMIRDMESTGKLSPGMTIVEASSGNTGTSLSMMAGLLGYKALVVVPSKTSYEKVSTMKAFGAEVVICPKNATAGSADHYMNKAFLLATTLPNTILLGQYESKMNVETHASQTAVELWEQMDGKIDYVIATASSGGTITGIATYLKSKNSSVKIIMPDPIGSVFYHFFHNKPDASYVPYQVEGAGKESICAIHDFDLIDDVIQFSDEEAYAAIKKLAITEGILAGGSSGGVLSILDKLKTKLEIKKEKPNIVVILPDSGFKYLSSIYRN